MKKILYSIISITIISLVIICLGTKENNKNAILIENKSTSKNVGSSAISMMYETEAGSGVYEVSTDTVWPVEGYTFNETLSKCENGSTLSWNSEKNIVVMTANISDKCYVFFDKEFITLVNYIIENVYVNDGVNGLYYHDGLGTYTNANQEAGDNSYRYSSNKMTLSQYAVENGYNSVDELITYYCLDYEGEEDEDNCYSLDSTMVYGLNYKEGYYYTKSDAIEIAITDGYLNSLVPNNYVCFGTDEENCSDDNLYRIIGIFNGEIKLIKNTSADTSMLGTNGNYNSAWKGYRWSNNSESNAWSDSYLNTINLNQNFINYLNNIDKKWIDLIENHDWVVGGNTSSNLAKTTIKNAYINEIVSPATDAVYNAKIGLMYVSDYGYAANPEYWITNLSGYNVAAENVENWLYMGNSEWTITCRSDNLNVVGFIYSGNVDMNGTFYSSGGYFDVRPTFYLNSNVKYTSGSGTASDPYRLSV